MVGGEGLERNNPHAIPLKPCKATWKREFKLLWREAGPPNHHDDKVDSDQQVVNKELSLTLPWWSGARASSGTKVARNLHRSSRPAEIHPDYHPLKGVLHGGKTCFLYGRGGYPIGRLCGGTCVPRGSSSGGRAPLPAATRPPPPMREGL